MSRDEAYQVLGLKSGATPDDIKAAHKRLMKEFHPDRGGSDYLAAKINAAKDDTSIDIPNGPKVKKGASDPRIRDVRVRLLEASPTRSSSVCRTNDSGRRRSPACRREPGARSISRT